MNGDESKRLGAGWRFGGIPKRRGGSLMVGKAAPWRGGRLKCWDVGRTLGGDESETLERQLLPMANILPLLRPTHPSGTRATRFTEASPRGPTALTTIYGAMSALAHARMPKSDRNPTNPPPNYHGSFSTYFTPVTVPLSSVVITKPICLSKNVPRTNVQSCPLWRKATTFFSSFVIRG